MLKKLLPVICLLFTSTVFAQIATKISSNRYIKFSLADTVLKIDTPVKNQLNNLLNKKKSTSLHLLLIPTDKTGITNTSRWLAAKQQQDIYRINLSAVISKYIGETEKNLEKLFSTAEAKNFILLFDEADDLFGQRSSDEKESNTGINYFLQRSAAFKGTIIVTCNTDNCISLLANQNFIMVK